MFLVIVQESDNGHRINEHKLQWLEKFCPLAIGKDDHPD